MSEEFLPDALGRLYVAEGPEQPHPGKVHAVLPEALGYALGQGYVQCAPPSATPPPAPEIVTPAPVTRPARPVKRGAASAA